MEIRELKKEDDLNLLVRISQEYFYEYESSHPYFFKIDKITAADITDYFARFIGHVDRKAFAAFEDSLIVGYIAVYVKEQTGFWNIKKVGDISGLMVQKDHRRQGIGRELLKRATEYFKQKEVKQYTLFTSANNRSGIEFYRKCGLEDLQITLLGEVE
jgi:ribosomal protein S18 acetylase RimI-like enzyme